MKDFYSSLHEYVLSPEHPYTNFEMGRQYENLGQTASAVSYYLRCAERSDDLLSYECLIRMSLCFDSQGNRNNTITGMLQRAICLMPKRPEAYFLLSRHFERLGEYKDCYTYASIALEICNFDLSGLRTDVDYPGKYGLIFEKAVSAWWWGKWEESLELLRLLDNEYEMDELHTKSVRDNLEKLDPPPTSHEPTLYTKSQHKNLRYKFKGSENIEQNHSQVYQDMFVLSMLDGKRDGKFLEVGGARPYYGNNTALLEEQFGWKGVSIEFDQNFAREYQQSRPGTPVLCVDALTVNYKNLLSKFGTKEIDYLQLDIDPPGNTFQVLLSIPFDEYKFAVITYEHDYYIDETKSYRDKSRNYLRSQGYILIADNIAPDDRCAFEDWWVHPDLIDKDIINRMMCVDGETKKAENYMIVPQKEEWRNTNWPTLEFTTSIPEKGCVVDCAICPQRTLEKTYQGQRVMTFDNFKDVIDKLPEEVRVTFAGFTEPWLNNNCTDMLLYANEKGHPISVFTTGIGMKVNDVYRLKDVPYTGNPNGGFVLHLPDQDRIAKHPITPNYIKVLEAFKEIHGEIQNFYTMAMGPVHEDVKHIFPEAVVPEFWSRAGNLMGEAMMKPELLNRKDLFRSVYHGEEPRTCGCDEDLYHNIVLPNGDVSLCCMDYNLKHILGNIYEQSYDDIVPKHKTCFDMCRFCENGVKP